MVRQALGLLLVGAVVGGCESSAEVSHVSHVSIGTALKRQDDQLVGQRFRTLLDFESDSDAVFAKPDAAGHRETGDAHTGVGSLHADGGASFKIDSLLYGTPLPGEWTLLGVYVKPEAAGTVTARLLIGGRATAAYARDVPAGTWAFVGIDLADPQTAKTLAAATSQHIVLHLSVPRAVYDDVLLVNNTRSLVDHAGPADWHVEQRGGALRATAKASNVTIPLAGAAENGWAIDEIGPRRLCLHRGGEYLTLLPDGRSISNGVTKSVTETATLEIPDESGRLDRDTPGDADNDGFNERLGSFEVKASGPRLTMKLSPAAAPPAAPMQSPLIEIAGLATGKITVMAEGKLIDTVARLPDGRVLVLLPICVDQTVEIVVRSSDNR